MILLDANILVRLANRYDPDYAQTFRALAKCQENDSVVLAPQTIYEFWAVATRSLANNGLGMAIDQVRERVRIYQSLYHVVSEPPEILAAWTSLVAKYQITGFRVHDVRYVAMVQLCGISHLMTYNVKHYQRFPVAIIDPFTF